MYGVCGGRGAWEVGKPMKRPFNDVMTFSSPLFFLFHYHETITIIIIITTTKRSMSASMLLKNYGVRKVAVVVEAEGN